MIMSGLRAATVAAFAIAMTGLSAYSGRPEAADATSSVMAKRIPLTGPGLAITATGTSRAKSILNIRRPISFGHYVWDEQDVPAGKVEIKVDLPRQIISVYRAGHEIGTAVILYGANEKPTPSGRFPILEKRKDHRSNLYDADMPYTLRLTNDGIAIHGSDVRRNAATHGCIGVPVKFAALLFDQVRLTDNVFIMGA